MTALHLRSTTPARLALIACAAIICALMVAATPAAAADPVYGGIPVPPTPKSSWAARVLAPTPIRVAPAPTAKSIGILRPTAPLGHGPTILLVLEMRIVDGIEWTRLLLARRPNGISGWVRSDVLRFRENPMRIIIDQSDRRTYVQRRGKTVLSVRNAIGKPTTPTPFGRFAVAEEIPVPNGFLGPMVIVATGFSEVLNEYAGGNGRFALHGTSLPALIGTRASNGCIRHRNDTILRIAALVSPGTPIIIRR